MISFFRSLLGSNPSLPFYWHVPNPMHGQEAKNHHRQKVIFDEVKGKWVMPQNFTDAPDVTIS